MPCPYLCVAPCGLHTCLAGLPRFLRILLSARSGVTHVHAASRKYCGRSGSIGSGSYPRLSASRAFASSSFAAVHFAAPAGNVIRVLRVFLRHDLAWPRLPAAVAAARSVSAASLAVSCCASPLRWRVIYGCPARAVLQTPPLFSPVFLAEALADPLAAYILANTSAAVATPGMSPGIMSLGSAPSESIQRRPSRPLRSWIELRPIGGGGA